MRCALVPVTRSHVDAVASKMRTCDRAEIWASSHSAPRAALRRGVAASSMTLTGIVDGRPVCVMGVAPASLLSGIGTPWMLSTAALERAARPMLRLSLPLIDAMNERFPRLVNYVDNRNVKTIRWLDWLGFEIGEPSPHGLEGLLFRRFERIRHV